LIVNFAGIDVYMLQVTRFGFDHSTTQENELSRNRIGRYQKEFLFNPDAEHWGIRL